MYTNYMKTKQFIRVEHKDTRRGMFSLGSAERGVYSISRLKELADRHANFPGYALDKVVSPYFVGKDSENNPWRFCFLSMDNFELWVKREEVKVLNEEGYRVYTITSDNYVESKFQSIVKIDSILAKEDITDLFLK